jgi:group I intron endonuclease
MIGYIYKIVNSVNNMIYVGSTKQSINIRFNQHKANSKDLTKNAKIYLLMRKIGVDKFNIEVIEQIEFLDKKDLLNKEQYFIDNLKPELNMLNTYHNKQEYREENKEYFKKYYEENKQEINLKNKEYREENKEKIKKYEKEYREENKKEIKEWKKKHYETNKKEIILKRKEKYTCECGSISRITDKSRHTKTAKHNLYINFSQ